MIIAGLQFPDQKRFFIALDEEHDLLNLLADWATYSATATLLFYRPAEHDEYRTISERKPIMSHGRWSPTPYWPIEDPRQLNRRAKDQT